MVNRFSQFLGVVLLILTLSILGCQSSDENVRELTDIDNVITEKQKKAEQEQAKMQAVAATTKKEATTTTQVKNPTPLPQDSGLPPTTVSEKPNTSLASDVEIVEEST